MDKAEHNRILWTTKEDAAALLLFLEAHYHPDKRLSKDRLKRMRSRADGIMAQLKELLQDFKDDALRLTEKVKRTNANAFWEEDKATRHRNGKHIAHASVARIRKIVEKKRKKLFKG